MAERPIFIPSPDSSSLVEEVFLPLHWNSGFAVVQKEKNIRALHSAADAAGIRNVLEVSSKSDNKRGQHLSAFYLKVKNKRLGEISLGSAFQGSKVFEKGGPYNDLYPVEPRFAKRDQRLQESGKSSIYSQIMDLPKLIGSKTAHVGFTAADGLYISTVFILKWTYRNP